MFKLPSVGLVVLVAGVFVQLASALYSPSDDVVMLTSANFNSKVIQSSDLWLVEFFAPWCGHCKSLAPEWKKAAKALKGIVKLGAVDMDQDQSVGAPYSIQGFPTIKIFGANKNSPSDFRGGRTAQAIVDEAMAQLRSLVKDRLSGGSGGKSSSSSGGSGGTCGGGSGNSGTCGGGSGSGKGSGSGSGSGSKKDVIELTDANFDSLVMDSDDMWLVEFFAPWCGHCKNLEPEWARAAAELKGKVKLGAVDATVHQSIASRFNVRGYPTIKYFGPGRKSPSGEEFDGGRTSGDIVQWALNKFSEHAPAPELVELTKQSQLEEACGEKPLCLVSFLPSLYDCQSKCREKHLKMLRKAGDKFKRNQWAWLWTESSKHPKLEEALNVGGFGYPAMVAVNPRKAIFVHLKGSFGETGVNEFLRELSVGRGAPQSLPGGKLPSVESVEAWDGKDAKIVEEEEIDLSDVSLDDDDDIGIPMRRKSSEL